MEIALRLVWAVTLITQDNTSKNDSKHDTTTLLMQVKTVLMTVLKTKTTLITKGRILLLITHVVTLILMTTKQIPK